MGRIASVAMHQTRPCIMIASQNSSRNDVLTKHRPSPLLVTKLEGASSFKDLKECVSPSLCSDATTDAGEGRWSDDCSYSASPHLAEAFWRLEPPCLTLPEWAKGSLSRPQSRSSQSQRTPTNSRPQSRGSLGAERVSNSRPRSRQLYQGYAETDQLRSLQGQLEPASWESNPSRQSIPLAPDDAEIFGRTAGLFLSARPVSRSSSMPAISLTESSKLQTSRPLTYLLSDACEAETTCRKGRRRRSSAGFRAASQALMAAMQMGRRGSSGSL